MPRDTSPVEQNVPAGKIHPGDWISYAQHKGGIAQKNQQGIVYEKIFGPNDQILGFFVLPIKYTNVFDNFDEQPHPVIIGDMDNQTVTLVRIRPVLVPNEVKFTGNKTMGHINSIRSLEGSQWERVRTAADAAFEDTNILNLIMAGIEGNTPPDNPPRQRLRRNKGSATFDVQIRRSGKGKETSVYRPDISLDDAVVAGLISQDIKNLIAPERMTLEDATSFKTLGEVTKIIEQNPQEFVDFIVEARREATDTMSMARAKELDLFERPDLTYESLTVSKPKAKGVENIRDLRAAFDIASDRKQHEKFAQFWGISTPGSPTNNIVVADIIQAFGKAQKLFPDAASIAQRLQSAMGNFLDDIQNSRFDRYYRPDGSRMKLTREAPDRSGVRSTTLRLGPSDQEPT